ncbi:MAG: HAMP domain-containing histidine kinase [Candidatus Eisenbacteria bacterium]|nr:HAMP domain-containing histidine kinase [Candidatus Eisenbacteria bacterium]
MMHPDPIRRLEAYRTRGVTFAVLNLVVLAAVFAFHLLYVQLLGPPRMVLLGILISMFLVQVVLLFWHQGLERMPDERVDLNVTFASIVVTIAGAFFASLYGEGEDHHYHVVMLPAIVLAAFRFRRAFSLSIAGASSALMYYDVWNWSQEHPPADASELFEVTTVGLLFVVVALVVNMLAAEMRERSSELGTTVAELERTRDSLVAQEKLAAVGRLSSAIAHEIRNPVAMIHSSLAAASRGGLDEDVREQMFRVATDEAGRLERLTTDFLAYAHTRQPQPAPTDAGETLAVVAELTAAKAQGAGVEIRVAPTKANGVFDPFMIHQALLNLALNAVASTPRGRRVELSAEQTPGALLLHVRNDGKRIPAEAERRIFEPFFTTRSGGTGLGLAIARGIARAHGGDVALTRNEDEYVCFTLSLPLPGAGAATGGK